MIEPKRLAAFDVFAELPPTELDALAAVMQETSVAAGETVVTHGEFGYTLYCIEDGEADVTVDGAEPVPPLGPGQTFGEIGLLVTGRRTATVVARTPLRLLSLFDHEFQSIRRDVPELEHALRLLGGERWAR